MLWIIVCFCIAYMSTERVFGMEFNQTKVFHPYCYYGGLSPAVRHEAQSSRFIMQVASKSPTSLWSDPVCLDGACRGLAPIKLSGEQEALRVSGSDPPVPVSFR